MKKIMCEWKKWLFETEKTKKFLGQPSHQRAGEHDRAVVKIFQQKDFRSAFKEIFGNQLRSVHSREFPSWFIDKLSDEEKLKIAKDLSVREYIYSGKSDYEIVDRNNVRSGVIYDDQPDVVNSPIQLINKFLETMDIQVAAVVPSDKEVREVYIFYVKPNYGLVDDIPQDAPKKNPFAKQMSFSADQLKKMNRDLWLKNKRKK